MKKAITQALEPQLKQLHDKLQQLPENDRKALTALVIVVGLLLFYFIIFQPIQNYHDHAQQNAAMRQELYQWLESKQSQVKALKKTSPAGQSGNQSLLTLVTTTLKETGISVKRIQPEGNDRIRVWLEAIPFNRLLGTLNRLRGQYGLNVEEISVDRQKPGKVDARITIKR